MAQVPDVSVPEIKPAWSILNCEHIMNTMIGMIEVGVTHESDEGVAEEQELGHLAM